MPPPRVSAAAVVAAVVASVAAVACDARRPIGVRAWDSAGVRIVESRLGEPPPPVARVVAPTPSLDLALVPGHGVDLGGILAGALLPSGDVALLSVDGALHRYGPAGTLRWSLELDGLGLASGPGDSVTVLRGDDDELAVVGAEGEVRAVPLDWSGVQPLGTVLPVAAGFVALTGWTTAMVPADARPGIRVDPALILRFGAEGGAPDTVGVVAGTEVGVVSLAGRLSVAPVPFGRVASLAARGARAFLGHGTSDEIVEMTLDGALVGLYRREGRDLALSPSDVEAARIFRRRLAGAGELGESIARELDGALPIPDRRPPYSELLVDETGRLWVADAPNPGEAPRTWSLFESDGSWSGRIVVPVGLRLLDVARERVLGHVAGPGASVRIHAVGPPPED